MRILGLGAAVLALALASPTLAADMDKDKKLSGEKESTQQQPSTVTQQDAGQAATSSDAKSENMAADSGEKMSDKKKAGDMAKSQEVGKNTAEPMNMSGAEGKKLVGKTLIGAKDQEVGEIKDVLMTDDGMVQSVLVDVGGFLGIGAKTVAVQVDKIEIQDDKVIARSLTKEAAENMAEYKAKQG